MWKCLAIDGLWFGYQFEYDAGNNMPKKCDKFQLDKYAKTTNNLRGAK